MRTFRLAAEPLLLLLLTTMLLACKETGETDNEFADWRSRNEKYYTQIHTKAKADADKGDKEWKILTGFMFEASDKIKPEDQIVVQVLKNGEGKSSPLYNDSVRIHVEGKLIPSEHHPEGLIFQKNYEGQLDPEVAKPLKKSVSELQHGLQTALQHMHRGDRWRVYVPYKMGFYGNKVRGVIFPGIEITGPAYSTLIYDLTLVDWETPKILTSKIQN